MVCTVTGDLSTLTTFASTIPFVLLQRGYSREFEAEADAYAVQLLLRAQADPRSFAAILKKLEESRPDKGNDFSYLGTHPGTEQRIQSMYATAQGLGWKNPGPLPTPPASAAVHPKVEKQPDVQPKAVTRPPPLYPAALRAEGTSGSVTLEFIIDELGDVQEVTVIRSSHPGFEVAALTAVSKWKFEPARKGGRAVRTLASQKLEFNVDAVTPTESDRDHSRETGITPDGRQDGSSADHIVPVRESEDHRPGDEQE